MSRNTFDYLFLCSKYQHMSALKQVIYLICNNCIQCNPMLYLPHMSYIPDPITYRAIRKCRCDHNNVDISKLHLNITVPSCTRREPKMCVHFVRIYLDIYKYIQGQFLFKLNVLFLICMYIIFRIKLAHLIVNKHYREYWAQSVIYIYIKQLAQFWLI